MDKGRLILDFYIVDSLNGYQKVSSKTLIVNSHEVLYHGRSDKSDVFGFCGVKLVVICEVVHTNSLR